jgi:predicted dithiol-disulfide oxidoreductase (DUF899 family)
MSDHHHQCNNVHNYNNLVSLYHYNVTLLILSFLFQRQPEQCRNCLALEETLQTKLKELRSKDESIAQLLQHGQKMAKQLSKQVIKFAENKFRLDLLVLLQKALPLFN